MLILLLISEFYIKVDKIWLKKNKYSKKSNYSSYSTILATIHVSTLC